MLARQNAGVARHLQLARAARVAGEAFALVEYEAEFDILRPADVERGNRRILYEVLNRGRKNLLPVFHVAPETSPTSYNDPVTATDAGTGFTFRAGYTLVWSGWDPDAPLSITAWRCASRWQRIMARPS